MPTLRGRGWASEDRCHPSSAPTGVISVSSGVLTVAGTPIQLKGLAVLDSTMGSTPPAGIRALFGPSVNAIMLAIGADGGGYQTAQPTAAIVSYVEACNAAGMWVCLSDYVPGQPQGRSGQDLTNCCAWYSQLSQAVAGKQVFWTTSNEVQGPLDTSLAAIYQAIRGAGDQNLILIEPSWPTSLSRATVAGMTGVGWNLHIYPWEFASLPPDQATRDAALQSTIDGWRNFGNSLDGPMPVVNGEGGNSTSGNGVPPDDPLIDGKYATVQACLNLQRQPSGLAGNLFWLHDWHGQGGAADTLVVNGALTNYGRQVVAGFG